MTTAITTYRQVTETKVISYDRIASLSEVKHSFLRYAKTYRLAYGKNPNANSLSIELSQYKGVTMEQLVNWLNEVK